MSGMAAFEADGRRSNGWVKKPVCRQNATRGRGKPRECTRERRKTERSEAYSRGRYPAAETAVRERQRGRQRGKTASEAESSGERRNGGSVRDGA